MHAIDLVLVACFALAWPAFGARIGAAALRAAVAAGVPGARRAEYASGMLLLWMFAALAAAAALDHGRSAEALRLLPPGGAGIAISLIAVVATIALFAVQQRSVATSPATRALLREKVRPLAWFLPQDVADRALFRPLSVTAGVCEEWLFRGYLLAVLEPGVGTAGAVGISTALFGLAHAYQGGGGILKTGLVGLFLAGLTWATGSIWAPIVVHAAADWMQGDLVMHALGEEAGASPALAAARP
jgi:membrane protease YdiL (CAAX protease family)